MAGTERQMSGEIGVIINRLKLADLGCVQEENRYEPVIQAALLDEFILHLKNNNNAIQVDYVEEVIFMGNMLFKQTHSHNSVNISGV